jgi:hypothetical protein
VGDSEIFSNERWSGVLSYQDLIQNYPPLISNKVKEEFYATALEKYKDQQGSLSVFQCAFNEQFDADGALSFSPLKIKLQDDFFNYAKDKSSEACSVWHLNFADARLFGFYGSDLFAQDEIQTLEHPLLFSVCEYLSLNRGKAYNAWTINRDLNSGLRIPTPVLVQNVPYWICVNTRPVLSGGRIGNLYGNNFCRASKEEILAGIKVFDGNVKSNIIAVAALAGGSGTYSKTEIEFTLKTLLCAFEKARSVSNSRAVAVHTGNWGCGAFGGNKEFMYLVQMIAAGAVGIDEIVFHSVDQAAFSCSKDKFSALKNMNFGECVDYLFDQKYNWGIGDGN